MSRGAYLRQRLRAHLAEGGWGGALLGAGRYLGDALAVLPWRRLTYSRRQFDFAGRSYRYFSHLYNRTWRNERAVELPLGFAALAGHDPEQVLEVGNVLRWYRPVAHLAIDKYEAGPGVLAVDAAEFIPDRRYELILSVSTIEHIGWDELPHDPAKALRTIEHLAGYLVSGGELLATWPVGWNPALDEALRAGRLPFDEVRALRRIAAANLWAEVPPETVHEVAYAHPWPGANAILVGRRRG